ncbi:MAG: arylsulfatase [Kiritimatiellaeota bacterium]|nr:arylsulfatase [Kiritimatiellota bacterium]
MKRTLTILTALLLVPLAALDAADKTTPANKPNVIIVLTDDQGYGDLSLTGNPILKTPNMDRLAREGVQFTNFHVDSYCTPTRSALMTGRYSHRVGGWGTVNGRNMLRDDEVTMADVFRHNGYRTGHFGKWHLGTNYPYRPIDRGFDEWLGHGDGGTGCTTDYWGNDRVNDHYIHNGQWETQPRPGFEGDVFFDAAMQFIRENKTRPFFTYLAVYNPHSPCSIPDLKWAAPYRGKKVPGDFFATIAHIDENLGRLRQFLHDEGLARNTLLIFLSDNGTAQGEKVFNAGMRGKKGSPYDGGHREPCFLYWPAGGFDHPQTVDRLTAHLDWLPTLVDLCGLQLPKPVKFDGVSLNPLLVNPHADWPDRKIVMGAPHNDAGANYQPPSHGHGAVMTDRWRLVNLDELYDMPADPGQTRDVAKAHPDILNKLRAAYEKYWVDVSARDVGWRGRPIIGSARQPVTDLCGEDWYTTQGTCPFNQGAVAAGRASFGRWPIRVAEAGNYRVEVRRWPRELDAPMAGVPTGTKVVDAWLDGGPVRGTLYGGTPTAVPAAKVRLKIGNVVQEADVAAGDTVKAFVVQLAAGPTDVEATLLDKAGHALCSAYYVSITGVKP